MAMLYQCLQSCGKVLVAARGSSIDLFSSEDGSLLSTWQCPPAQYLKTSHPLNGKSTTGLETQKSGSTVDVVESSPPAKRRKLFNGDEEETQTAPEKHGTKKEQKGGKKENKRLDAVVSGLGTPAVIALAATEDGRHVIAVTGEDKSIRVFENVVDEDGRQWQKQLSQRVMPKRPCAIAITADSSTIISADKFGDVYSLPLLFSVIQETPQPVTPTPEPATTKPFVSAANHLTVHSQRNRKALESQKKQTTKPAEKSEPTFEHKLLLGHVSMLTDLALITTAEGKNYILTADRDEHIRVSRGIPQAHIIENFCLGHTEFISRLCIPKERPDVLISGGGDDSIFVWDWMSGSLICKENLRQRVEPLLGELYGQDLENGAIEPFKVAVSGIKHVGHTGSDGVEDLVIVTCEGIPAVFTFLLNAQSQLEILQNLKLTGNVLDVAIDAAGGIILSIDTIHKPASATRHREPGAEKVDPLQRFVFEGRKLVPSTIKFEVPKCDEEFKNGGQLMNLFYSLENLRKRDDGREEE